MFDLHRYMEEKTRLVDEALDRVLPGEQERPARLHQAMRYSLFAGGKRLRPILCLAAAESLCGDGQPALMPALALECLHTYTLIHDDLPAMDNDDLRRGRPTSHKVFGEANAILAGDSLLTFAFELLARPSHIPAANACRLAEELASASGSRGVTGGQFEDLAAEGQPPDPDRLEFIHINKTAKLIRAACRMGAIAAGAREEHLRLLSDYGDRIGLAFQIADDILNATATAEQLGKAAGSDAERNKMTYVALFGIDASREKAAALSGEATALIDRLPQPSAPLKAIAEFIVARNK